MARFDLTFARMPSWRSGPGDVARPEIAPSMHAPVLAVAAATGAVLYFIAKGQLEMAIALAVAPLAVVFVTELPLALAIAFFACSAFRLHEVIPGLLNLKVPFLLGSGAIMGVLIHVMTGRATVHFSRPLQLFLLTVILVLIGSNLSIERDRSVQIATEYAKVFAAALALTVLARRLSDLHRIVWTMFASGSLLGAIIVYNKIHGIGLVEGTRAVVLPGAWSMLNDPNDAATLLAPVFALACVQARASASIAARCCGLAVALLILVAVIATQSRGGVMAIVGVTGFLGWNWVRPRILLAPIIVVAGLVLLSVSGISDRSSGGWQSDGPYRLDDSAGQRLIAWKAAWNMAVAHPFTGVGTGAFKGNFFYYTDEWIRRDISVHSSWFQVLGETGFLSFFSFVGMITAAFLSLRRSERRQALGTGGGLCRQETPAVYVSVVAFGLATALLIALWHGLAPGNSWLRSPPLVVLVASVLAWSIVGMGYLVFSRTDQPLVFVTAGSRESDGIETMALGLQAALIGFCISASFVTHAFEWLLYLLICMAVVLEKILYTSSKAPVPLLSHARPRPFRNRNLESSR